MLIGQDAGTVTSFSSRLPSTRCSAASSTGSSATTPRLVEGRPWSADRIEGGGEVAKGGGLVDDAVASELGGVDGDVLADFDHVVDVALRIGPARDGQAHQIQRCWHLR